MPLAPWIQNNLLQGIWTENNEKIGPGQVIKRSKNKLRWIDYPAVVAEWPKTLISEIQVEVVSIGFFWFCFMPFLYTGVYMIQSRKVLCASVF